jgi:hypothetical protein
MATESNPPGSEEPILNVLGERVALGPLREDLLPLYGRWINDFRTIRILGLPPAPVTAEKERDYHWWISGFLLVGLAALGIALGGALLGLLIPGPPP